MRIYHLTLLHTSRCSCYLAPVTYLSERKIEIFAVPTDPISNPLSERFLNLLLENHHLLLHYFILIGVLHVLILFVAAHTIRADSLKRSIVFLHLRLSVKRTRWIIILVNNVVFAHYELLRRFLSLFKKMLRLPIEILLGLNLLAPIAFQATIEVIVLAL